MHRLFKILESRMELLRENGYLESDISEDIYSSIIEVDQEAEISKEVLYNLDSKKLYLDPSISLIKLSAIVGTNTTYLSNSINKHFGCNFKTLINKYRVEHCKKLLSTSPLSVPIKEIAKNSGYTSVSAFYASFKKVTGVSPVQYRILIICKKINKEFDKNTVNL